MNAEQRHEALKLLLEEFIESYAQKKEKLTINEWLSSELKEHLPDKPQEEIDRISSEILSNLAIQEAKKISLEKSAEQGRSKESWFASELKKDTASMSGSERDEFLRSVDGAVSKNQAETLNLIRQDGTETITPEIIPPVTNDYQANEAARIIGKKVSDNSTINIVISSDVIEAVSKKMKGNNSAYTGTIEAEFSSGNDRGIKTAAAGAIYTGAEIGVIDVPYDNRPVLSSASAFQGVETAEILSRDLPFEETVDRLERTSVSVCSGIVSAIEGAKAGAAAVAKIGSAFGWLGSAAGTVIGGLIGGVTGYMAGGRIGDSVVQKVQKIRPGIIERAANTFKTVAKAAWEGVKSVGRTVLSWFGF